MCNDEMDLVCVLIFESTFNLVGFIIILMKLKNIQK